MTLRRNCQSIGKLVTSTWLQRSARVHQSNLNADRLRHFSIICNNRHNYRLSGSNISNQILISNVADCTTSVKSGTYSLAQHKLIYNHGRRSMGTQIMRPYVDPKLSYAFGRSHEHLVYTTVARELDRQIREVPNEVAFVSHYEDITKTFRQFGEDVDKLAKSLVTGFHMKKGDRIGVFAYNCYNWIVVQYACSRIGAILIPINPSYKGDELAYVLKSARVKCLFMPGPKSIQKELNNHLHILQSNSVMDMLDSSDRPPLESVILMDSENDYNLAELDFKLGKYNCQVYQWSSVQSDGRVFRSAQEADEAGVKLEDACILSPELVSPDDLFAVYYTSGTTGKPKGACCSQFTVINNVRLCQIRLRIGRPRNWRAIISTTLPMFHIFAGVLNALSPIVGNSMMVLSSYKYDIRAYVESIIKHGSNLTTLTPTMLIDLLTFIEQESIRNVPLRFIQPGGAYLPPELVARTFKVLPELEEIRTGYGSSENGAVATFQSIYEPEATRAHTVGQPVDLTEIRIVKPGDTNDSADADGDGCRVLPLGERGEIQTRGYNTMTGYLDDPAKTREVLTPNRWYRTGDIGFMHPHGSIEICGRLKHMIIKGGENIYPEEVEQMMHKLECIEKVHVVGVPDKRFGEQVCAWVKLKPGYKELKGDYPKDPSKRNKFEIHEKDIINFCLENITYFKVPKYLLFVDDFPMTPTKKVQNHLVLERTIEILGLNKEK